MTIAIIGAGAAGLMAAATIAELHPQVEVLLIERNNGLGKKVLISGGGRCNVTTGIFSVRTVLTKYPRGNKFLNSAIHTFPPEAVYNWFESHGVPLKIEADLRVFPQSNNGHDIVGVFETIFADANVHQFLNRHVVRISKNPAGGFGIMFKDGDILDADKVILTTGGQAFRQTGSTGDGYAFAESLGHHITPLAPSLSAFFSGEHWPKDLAGLSFSKVGLRTNFAGRAYSFVGPILFTHRGVTGPAVFALSSLVAFEAWDESHPLQLFIDLFPDLTNEDLNHQLDAAFRSNGKKLVTNVLDFLLPKSLAETVCHRLEIPDQTKAGDLTKKDLGRIIDWLKGAPLHIIARGGGDEFVTAGGVDLSEVDQRTMESKITPGLYFAGEVLDIDGFTGGFNLQASWSTGRAAGDAAGASAE